MYLKAQEFPPTLLPEVRMISVQRKIVQDANTKMCTVTMGGDPVIDVVR